MKIHKFISFAIFVIFCTLLMLLVALQPYSIAKTFYGNVEVINGVIKADNIEEKSTDNGVIIEGITLLSGRIYIDGKDVSSGNLPYFSDWSYRENEMVVDDGTIYISQQAGNMGNALTDTTWWLPVTTGGTTNHSMLTNRDAVDSHPVSAITGLQTLLDTKQNDITGSCTGQVVVGVNDNGTLICEDDDEGAETDPIYSAWDKDYTDLINTPIIPTATSQLTNDSGFITGYTETDPTFSSSPSAGISSSDISDWATAYLWGDHALAGYLSTSDIPGSNTYVIYNDSGSLGAEAGLTYNPSTNQLTAEAIVGDSIQSLAEIRIGNSTDTTAGNIRWSGTDFEGHNGSNWLSLTQGGVDEIVYQTDCSGITNGFCIDTDDGTLYYWDAGAVVEVAESSFDPASPGDIGTTTPGQGYFTYLNIDSLDINPPPSGSTGEMIIHEDPDNGTDVVGFKAPSDVATGDSIWVLPGDDGTNGQVLATDGLFTLEWVDVTTQLDDLIDIDDEGNTGYVLKDDGDGTYSFQAETAGGATNLSNTPGSATVDIHSSSGTDTTIPAATTSLAGVITASDKTKIDGIATGATANSTDAYLLNRENHTGVQYASSIADFDFEVAANSFVLANTAKEGLSTGAVDADELASTAVTPGSYTNADITVDEDGRITAANSGSSGTGDVTGPGSSTDNTFPRFDGTGGKTLQAGQTTEDDSGNVAVAGDLNITGDVSANNFTTAGAAGAELIEESDPDYDALFMWDDSATDVIPQTPAQVVLAGGGYTSGEALGTPSSGTLTNTTGLPISTGVSGLGTGVATALANSIDSAGGVASYSGLSTAVPANEADASVDTASEIAAIINTSPPVLKSMADITSDADGINLTDTECGEIILMTGTGEVGMPDCDTDLIGCYVGIFVRDASEQVEVVAHGDTTNDLFRLSDGTETDANDEVDLTTTGNEFFSFICMEENKWYVWSEADTVIDGGVAD